MKTGFLLVIRMQTKFNFGQVTGLIRISQRTVDAVLLTISLVAILWVTV